MEAKKPWESKVMILNAVTGLVAFLSMFVPSLAFVPAYIAAHPAEVAMAFTLVNMILRMFKSNIQIGE
jgi:hypothetical protein